MSKLLHNIYWVLANPRIVVRRHGADKGQLHISEEEMTFIILAYGASRRYVAASNILLFLRCCDTFAVQGRSLRIFSDDNFTSIILPFLRAYNMEMKHFMCHCCTLAKMYISPLSIDWDLRDVSRCSGSRATDQYFWGTSRETPCITNIFHIQHIHVQTMQ